MDYLITEIRTQGMNHVSGLFKLQSEACPFCLLEYDVIARMESFQEDFEYVMDALGIKQRLEYRIHVNRCARKQKKTRSRSERESNTEFHLQGPAL